jgi:DNA-binding response OmpR family regulator
MEACRLANSVQEPTHTEVQVLQAIAYLLKPFSLVELTNGLQLALSQSDLLSE